MFKFFKNKQALTKRISVAPVPPELDPVTLAAANRVRKAKENRANIEKHAKILREELTVFLKKHWVGERLIWYPEGRIRDHPEEALLEALSAFSGSYTFEVVVIKAYSPFYKVIIEAK